MRNRPVRILHLEDDPLDGERVRECLREEGIECAIDRVQTHDDFAVALAGDYDLILADYRLSDFDGEAALALARDHAPDAPFIFVSGPIGEDVKAAALKRGATDCVVKQPLEQLADVIRRVLDEIAEREWHRSVERTLHPSTESFAIFADVAQLLCWMAEPDGYIHWYNQRWYDYTGTEAADMAGWGWRAVYHPDVLPKVIEAWRSSIETGEPWEMVFPLRGADGEYRNFLTRAAPVKDERGKVVRWIGTNVDISAQQMAEAALRDSEARYRLATTAAAVGIWDYDPVADRLEWDDACKAMFGVPQDAPISYRDSFQPAIHPDDRALTDAAVRQALDPAGPGVYDIEYRAIGIADGVERWIAAKGRGIFQDGRAIRFVGTVLDITERKQATAAAIESRDALTSESHALEILNHVSREIAAELDLGRLVQAVVDAGVQLVDAAFGAFFYNVLDRDGDHYMLYALSGADRSAFDRFPMVRSTPLFAQTFEGRGIVRLDDVLADPRFGQNPPYHGMPEGHLPVRSYLAAPVRLRSGEVIGGLFFGHREIGVFGARAERLIEGLAAQAAVGIENARLFESAQRLNQTLEQQVAARTAERDRIWQVSEDLLGVADAQGVWLSVNPAWTRVLGWEPDEIVGRTSEWIEHPDDREKTRAEVVNLAGGRVTTAFENRFRTRDGTYRMLSWRAVPADGEIYCVARDVTVQMEQAAALAETEERLRQAQKMETLGQLTGGVAHDFNNLLQIVMGNLEILKRTLPEEPARLRRVADNAFAGAERAATLTQRLLAFSRRQPLAPHPVNPNTLVAGMSDLLHRTLGGMIEISTTLAPEAWMVEVDANQLEGALLNLAVNARDAMAEGGRLSIAIANMLLEEPLITESGEVAPGDHVTITVSDTGGGMSPEVLERVFEPFFTTKDVGKGTGLGLSMVYGFVKQSGGHVKIVSGRGEGTSVTIYLPRLTVNEEVVVESVVNGPIRGGDETILVCEDNEGVRAYTVESLRELGYGVLEARDGRSALEILRERGEAVDLLFTDVVLPGGMTGSDLAAQAREYRPSIKILFTTGYERDVIVHHGRLDEGVELITKPFGFDDLALRVRRVLDRYPGAVTTRPVSR